MQFKQIFIPTKGRNTYTGLTYNTGTTIVNNGGAGGGGTNYWALENNIRISTEYEVIGKQDISAYGDGAFAAYSLSVIDNLTSTSTTDALSANQGRVLKQLIDNYSGGTASSVSWNNVTDKPTTIAGYGITNAYTKSQTDTLLAGKSSTSHTHTFASITNKPTTIVGYGITDAYTKSQTDTLLAGKSDTGHTHTFASITDKPTTIAGYGITDAYTKSQVDTFLAGKSDTGHTHTFSSITNKPTTIAGYGITDAYTSSQVNTIVSNYLPLSGGTLTGALYSNSNINASGTVTSNSIISVNDVSAYGGASSPSWSLSVIDNLTSTSTTDALSANQGRILKDLIDNFSGGTASSVSWNNVTNKPTTIAGYGITDAYTKSEIDTALAGKSNTGHTHTFASITNKPTTIAGYGITNAYTSAQVDNLLGSYVTLTTYQNITNTKVFTHSIICEYDSIGSYNEGLRVNNSLNGWGSVTIGAERGSTNGVTENQWTWCTYEGNCYFGRNGSSNYEHGFTITKAGSISFTGTDFQYNSNTVLHSGNYTGYTYSQSSINSLLAGKSDTGHTHTFASITSKPTTLAGYGITDAYTSSQVDSLLGGYIRTNYNAEQTISGNNPYNPLLSLDNTGSTAVHNWVYFKIRGNNKASVGYYNNTAFIANENTYARIGVKDDGTPVYNTSSHGTEYNLYHTGNCNNSTTNWYCWRLVASGAIQMADAGETGSGSKPNNFITAGVGYSVNSGRYGLKILCCDQYDAQSGLGQDICDNKPYNLCIAGCAYPDGSTYGSTSYITFCKHAVNSTDYMKLGQFDGSGNFTAVGEVYAYSDKRVKKDIKDLNNRGYLKPKTFVRTDIEGNNKTQIGFIAQDVQKLYPELITEDNGLLKLNYPQLTAVLSAQINEQKEEIDNLKNEVDELKSLIKELIKNKD